MKRVVLALLVMVGCSGISENVPTEPVHTDEPAPSPQTIVVTPVQIPSPVAGPAPTPQPTPNPGNPGPAPTSTPRPPTSSGCSLPPGGGSGTECRAVGGTFDAQVESALDQVIAQHPEYFDLSKRACDNCPLIVNGGAFEAAVIRALAERGLCAVGGEEFGVKNQNSFNDQYDLVTAANYVRRGTGAYRTTCFPAGF